MSRVVVGKMRKRRNTRRKKKYSYIWSSTLYEKINKTWLDFVCVIFLFFGGIHLKHIWKKLQTTRSSSFVLNFMFIMNYAKLWILNNFSCLLLKVILFQDCRFLAFHTGFFLMKSLLCKNLGNFMWLITSFCVSTSKHINTKNIVFIHLLV
jgi:hypothetical protein